MGSRREKSRSYPSFRVPPTLAVVPPVLLELEHAASRAPTVVMLKPIARAPLTNWRRDNPPSRYCETSPCTAAWLLRSFIFRSPLSAPSRVLPTNPRILAPAATLDDCDH